MLNVFRMHMYRVSKAKSTIVLGIVMMVSLLFALGMAYIIFDNPFNLRFGDVMVTVNPNGFEYTASVVMSFFVQTNSAFIICMTVFAVILTNCDFTRGFAKNTYSLFEHRATLVWAKWIALMTSVTAVYVVFSGLSLVLSALFVSAFEIGGWGEFIRGFIVLYILFVSLMTMVFWITNMFKSPAGGMVIGLLIATGVFQTIEKLLDLLILRISGGSGEDALSTVVGVGSSNVFKISDYCLDNVFLSYSPSMGSADTTRTVIVALVYLALALGLTLLVAEKRDVRC